MSRVIFARRALGDLKDIGAYISQRNEVAAPKWVAKLREACLTTIAMSPECGTQCDHLLPGMRCFSVGNYLIYFRGRNPVRILRIVHGAMEQEQLKFEPER